MKYKRFQKIIDQMMSKKKKGSRLLEVVFIELKLLLELHLKDQQETNMFKDLLEFFPVGFQCQEHSETLKGKKRSTEETRM